MSRVREWKHWHDIVKLLWALPCSAVGILLACVALLAGGRARWSSGALEVSYRESLAACGKLARRFPFRGIVFGHVILAMTREELLGIGPHERVHVQQYERWGLLFFPAYGASSIWQLMRGRSAYWDNHFEMQARALSVRTHRQEHVIQSGRPPAAAAEFKD